MFRAHRGRTNHGFYAHKARPHAAFKGHAKRALRQRRIKRHGVKPAKTGIRAPKYKSLLRATPATYTRRKTPAPYKSATPPPPAGYTKPVKPKVSKPVKPDMQAMKAAKMARARP